MTQPQPLRGGPTFICDFADGERTRMTVYCREGLDVARGVKLAGYAYESRKGRRPPAMVSATFVSSDGVTLATYDAETLVKVRSRSE
jgi:hypothetical protein